MNLKELSQELGLSQTTVSRALNGYPEVSEKTRRKVEDAARLHNYIPNGRAKRLATGRAMTIGHVLPVSKEHEMVNPIFSDFIAGAGERYRQSGYDILLTVVQDEDEASVYRELASRGDVDGVIIHGPRIDDKRIPLLTDLGLPFVVHGRSTDTKTDYSWVDVNNRRAFERATNFLIDLGHKNIALINGVTDLDFAARRQAGYLEALKNRGLPVGQMFSAEMTETYGYRTTRQLLRSNAPPTAIIVSSIIAAIGARRAIDEFDLRLGRDVSVITHDDDLSYFRNDGDIPIFTAVRSSVREAGRLAADMLLRKIDNSEHAAEHILLETELTVGQSTGPSREIRI